MPEQQPHHPEASQGIGGEDPIAQYEGRIQEARLEQELPASAATLDALAKALQQYKEVPGSPGLVYGIDRATVKPAGEDGTLYAVLHDLRPVRHFETDTAGETSTVNEPRHRVKMQLHQENGEWVGLVPPTETNSSRDLTEDEAKAMLEQLRAQETEPAA